MAARAAWYIASQAGSSALALTALLDLVSPIDTLADRYLFSAHIVQHFLLALVIPPLCCCSARLASASLQRRSVENWNALSASRPFRGCSAWARCSPGTFRRCFNAALASDGLHIFQHLSFLVTGPIFWWPILGPLEDRHLPALAAVSYLFSACLCCSLLGAF